MAIKVLPQHFTERPEAVLRFKREMKAVGKLEHANIVRAMDAGEINGTHFLAMEYVAGTDLQKLVQDQGPLSPANACRALRQAAIALAAAHGAGLIHRDIKPSNLLVAKNGQIKVLDLGLARLAGEANQATDLTAAGQAFGTPDYMAPEQWEDAREADPRTDLYALGCTLFFLLTGHAPFEDDKHLSHVSKMTAHVLDPVPDLLAARGGVPEGVSAIYQRLLAKQPADRFQTATELAEALHPFAAGKASAPGAAIPNPLPSRERVAAQPPGEGAKGLPMEKKSPPPDDLDRESLAARARSARELLDMHCYQEAIAVLEEIPGAEQISGMREVLFEARQRQFEINNLLGMIQQQMQRKDRAGRQQLRASLERLHILKPQHKGFETQLAQLERAERSGLRLPLPGLKDPLDIPWAAAIPAMIVAGMMAVMGVWVIVKDKSGKEVARVSVPEDGTVMVTTGDVPASGGRKSPVDSASGWHGWPADAPPPAIAPFDAAQAKKHQQAWADYLETPVEYANSIGMKFVLIPPGEFTMGSTAAEIEEALKDVGEDKYWQECIKSEAPQHKVILTQPIYLGVHEVTQKQYEVVMGVTPSYHSSVGGGKEVVDGLDTANHPVEQVSWINAADFCAKLSEQEKLKPFKLELRAGETTITPGTGYRLPTEAEWEFSCRAGTTTLYWVGGRDEDLAQASCFSTNSGRRTHAVGELKANPLGLFDIHGNVWEWVQDWWEPSYYGQFSAQPAINPGGPSSAGSRRAQRGGSWRDFASTCRSSDRGAWFPAAGDHVMGFRVALAVNAVQQATANPQAGN